MNRFPQYANLIGVVALTLLCVTQWSANRRSSLEASALEKVRQGLNAKVAEHEKTINGQAADLDNFREQLTIATAALKESESQFAKASREMAQLESERDQLKISVTNWAAAVTARDERIKDSNDRLKQLGEDLNASIRRFNELAETHGKLVKDWNDQQARLAAMRTNNVRASTP